MIANLCIVYIVNILGIITSNGNNRCLTDRWPAPRRSRQLPPDSPPLRLLLVMQLTFNCTHSHIIGRLGWALESCQLSWDCSSQPAQMCQLDLLSVLVLQLSATSSTCSYSQLGCNGWTLRRCCTLGSCPLVNAK